MSAEYGVLQQVADVVLGEAHPDPADAEDLAFMLLQRHVERAQFVDPAGVRYLVHRWEMEDGTVQYEVARREDGRWSAPFALSQFEKEEA